MSFNKVEANSKPNDSTSLETTLAQQETSFQNKKKLDKKTLRKIFWHSCMLDSSWNYERQQNMGYSFAITPAIDVLYDPVRDVEKRKRACKRSLDFMAVTPQLSTLLLGVNAAMEEQNATHSDFDDSVIAKIKTSLMGPLAGIGDSLIAGTLRIIGTGVAIGFAQNGSLLGSLLLLLIFNIPAFIIRYYSLKFGYNYGSEIIKSAAKSNIMELITFAASVVGLMAIGAMVASFVSFNIPLSVGQGEFAKPITDYFNMIMPGLPQLLLFSFMYWLLGRRGIKTVWVLLGTIVLCILCCVIGIML